jgi:hypothetical protein
MSQVTNFEERIVMKGILYDYYNEDPAFMDQADLLMDPTLKIQDGMLLTLLKARAECLVAGDASFVSLIQKCSKMGVEPGVLLAYTDAVGDGEITIYRPSYAEAVERVLAKSKAVVYGEALESYRNGLISHDDFAAIVSFGASVDEGDVMSFGEARSRVDNEGIRERVKTGFKGLDLTAGGLARGRVSILAARPGVGKSDLALNIAINVHNSGKKVLLCSPEMDYYEIVKRAENTLAFVIGDISGIILDVAPIQTVAHIAGLVARHKPDLVIVDHLQAMAGNDDGRSAYEKMTARANQLRIAAKGHVTETKDAPAWLVLCQLSRNARTEQQEPVLADLRDSGAIEENADAVIFLHECDEREPGQKSRRVQATTKKNRGGFCGKTIFEFHMARSYWEEVY